MKKSTDNKDENKWPVRETPDEAMFLVQPNYLRYGATSPQFADVGAARRQWIQRGRYLEFSLDEIGDQFRWYESEISARDIIIGEKSEEIKRLKDELKCLRDSAGHEKAL